MILKRSSIDKITLGISATLLGCAPLNPAPEESIAEATSELLGDALSLTQRPDGRFDVQCKDGHAEIVTLTQVQSGAVCLPKPSTPCAPNAKRCTGNVPEICDASGTGFTAGAACATACSRGVCAEAGLVIDGNPNATLDGEHVYAGDVVIKNNSVLTVPSGKLVLYAREFRIDASSRIVVMPTGADPRGKGGDGGDTSCNVVNGQGNIVCSDRGILGGAGGSYFYKGQDSRIDLKCIPYSSPQSPCSPKVATAGASYLQSDEERAKGAEGGKCNQFSGGKGGGMLAIYAENIVSQGALVANGQDGTGCAGGGSGGGVFLEATNDLNVAGAISVAGGKGGPSANAGAGGDGAIKLFYGNTKTINLNGTLPTPLLSIIPPHDVRSATHPNQNRFYNDGFSTIELAWSKPFEDSYGYRVAATKGPSTNYPGTPTYNAGEQIVFPAAASSSGTNSFYLYTIGPEAEMSKLASRFTVRINNKPPSITSASHPESNWTGSLSPYFTWTVPNQEADVANFYWVFDRYPSTMPTKSSNKLAMDLSAPQKSTRLQLVNQEPGIWFLHLIAEDTMGYLTKAATHYQVNLGPNPGQGSIAGAVIDGQSGKLLSGVSLSLNRGLYKGTTNSTTGSVVNYTLGGLAAQSYEIVASKAGYKDVVKTVTVTPGKVMTVDFTMTP